MRFWVSKISTKVRFRFACLLSKWMFDVPIMQWKIFVETNFQGFKVLFSDKEIKNNLFYKIYFPTIFLITDKEKLYYFRQSCCI